MEFTDEEMEFIRLINELSNEVFNIIDGKGDFNYWGESPIFGLISGFDRADFEYYVDETLKELNIKK